MPAIEDLRVGAYRVPTDAPESDGTACWEGTTIVVVRLRSAGIEGIGYSYTDQAAAGVVERVLKPLILQSDALATGAAFVRMGQAVRNLGRPGIAFCAVSAVDSALWDLKARLLGLSLCDLLGPVRAAIPVYGSGGFTSYSDEELERQTSEWVKSGIRMVKMKVGTHPEDDAARVREVRAAIGRDAALFVDANGAYTVKQAITLAGRFAEQGVTWFEEPVSSDDRFGLRFIRERVPMDVAAGEYGHDAAYFRAMLAAGSVDVIQADATRCGGPTGFLKAAALAEGFQIPLSSHTAPSLHLHLCCAAGPAVHLEWFHDHVRLERMLFDGAAVPADGLLTPDRHRPGMGISLKESEAARFAV